MIKPKIGLLPLYLELYDRSMPQIRPRIESFLQRIVDQLQERNLEVVKSPICRVKAEFSDAISSFEAAGADAIVTLHLAYSPSLESAEALAKTSLPIVALDTTPSYNFDAAQDPDEILYNHGIHGVQDMCNLLIRNDKRFQIEAGHWEKSDVLDRVARWAYAAKMASAMRNARVGLIGEPFAGMGDFAVDRRVLRDAIGVEIIDCDMSRLQEMIENIRDDEVEAELSSDLSRFESADLDADRHKTSVRCGLAVRRWCKEERLSAFTVNFLAAGKESGMPTAPFLEAGKAMARGIGYAGEGDVLTASLVGALASVFPETTFTETFCPDWAGESIFLSHMGEMNVDLTKNRAVLTQKPFPWSDAEDPVVAVGRMKSGGAALVNLAPGPNSTFTLIAAPVEMLPAAGADKMSDAVRGWFRPAMPISDFLEEYSRVGGTHHSALVYGDVTDDIIRFGKLMGWNHLALGL